MPGHILVETITFEEHDGKTTVSSTALFDSVEDRDGMLESGMESGATESWDRLAELLDRLSVSNAVDRDGQTVSSVFHRDIVAALAIASAARFSMRDPN